MIHLLLADTGRLHWGLGNPNKTGALIALLIPVVWLLVGATHRFVTRRPAREVSFYAGLLATGALGVCLMLTESRGGVVGACLALLLLLILAPRPWPKARVAAGTLLCLACIAGTAQVGAWRRMEPTYAAGDASITNRITLWKAAPAMMADAPAGWGAGRAGPEYGRWYQHPSNTQRYRVLVSSHLTFLVEHGSMLRILYLAGWLAALALATRHARAGGNPAWLAALVGQATAWQFSDVGESPWVHWGTAGVAAGIGIITIRNASQAGGVGRWLRILAGAGAVASALVIATGMIAGGELRREPTHTVCRGGKPETLVILPGNGDTAPSPREWRETLPDRTTRPTLIWPDDRPDIPSEAIHTLVCFPGASSATLPISAGTRLIFINPAEGPEETLPRASHGPVRVIYGEFARKTGRAEWEKVARVDIVEGESGYIPDWPGRILP